jgi:hypothetical protein
MINDELGLGIGIEELRTEEKFNSSSSIYINKITLDCLMSKKQRNKLGQDMFSIKYDKKDKKFYRRRIINLTREMLLNNNTEDILLDVKETFDAFVKACIGFFKVKDETDIIQADMNLNDLCFLEEITKDDQILDKDDIVTPEEANKLMMKTIKINKLPLDNFVTIKNLKISKEEPILPKQKDINLKDPILKNKGIRKKKNVDNQYIENENKNKENKEK